MRFKIMGMVAALALVAACETTPETASTAGGSGGKATAAKSGGKGAGIAALPAAKPLSPQDDLVVNVGDRIFFGFDRFDIEADQRDTLKRQAAWMKSNPNITVTIEGHADERGTREYNLALGERRANSIKDQLILLGVKSSRIKTVSFGEERPVALGSDESAWGQNRRGVTVVGAPGS